jgi:Mg-chelatase subunit ChlD
MLSHFRSRKRGSILVFFLLAVPLMVVPLVGLAVDATMLRIVQARLSAAVDGAALGTGRLLGTSATPQLIAPEFVRANFLTDGTAGFWNATNLQITATYTPGITKTIAVNATADVPLLFARIFGQSKATVAAAGTATRTDSRIMLVIDRSGSMAKTKGSDGNYPITDAVNDAVEFTQSFTPNTDEVGLVVFDGSAIVAYPTYAPGKYSSTPTASGGPDGSFQTPMVTLLQNISAGGATNTAEALWLAYVELQKAHLRDGNPDTRLNAIVFLTDGLPQGVTLYPNNTASYPANYQLKSTSQCTNKYTVSNPSPTPIFGAGYIDDSGGTVGSSYFTCSGCAPDGLYQLDSLDSTTSDTASWYMSHPGAEPYLYKLTNPTNVKCTGIQTMGSTTGNDLQYIPAYDAYGNTMVGSDHTNPATNYQNTLFVTTSGTLSKANNPIYSGTAMNASNVTKAHDWAQAAWNAADSAGQRIRSDINLANRAGDSKMPIYIYTIGYLANGGVDQGLLARIANDKALSSSYDSTSPAGKYYSASDPEALHNAFETVAATLLRLRQ